MMVLLTMISDDNDSDDATSDSVGNDFADWSNGPWWVVTTLAGSDTKAQLQYTDKHTKNRTDQTHTQIHLQANTSKQ